MHKPMLFCFGKRVTQRLKVDGVYPQPSSHLQVLDRKSKLQFLKNTGSNLCVVLRTYLQDPRQRTTYKVYTANGFIIPTYGWAQLFFDLSHRKDFSWNFVVADVTQLSD